MKYLTLDIYHNFKCIGSSCPNTCCSGWDILIDSKSAADYRSVSGSFGDKLRHNLKSINGSDFFCLSADGRCSFLDEHGLCEIYQNLGESALCHTCDAYPRTSETFGDITLNSLLISCPEVARLLFSHTDSLEFDFGENDTFPVSTDVDWSFFNILVSAFTISIDILQNHSFPFSTRLRMLIKFQQALQETIDTNSDSTAVLMAFSDADTLKSLSIQLNAIPHNPSARADAFHYFWDNRHLVSDIYHFTDILLNELSFTSFEEQLPEFSRIFPSGDTIFLENYCVYYLFMTFFRSYETRQPQKITAQLIYSLNLLQCHILALSKDGRLPSSDRICVSLSYFWRLLEHSDKNRCSYALYELYHKNHSNDIDFLLSLT